MPCSGILFSPVETLIIYMLSYFLACCTLQLLIVTRDGYKSSAMFRFIKMSFMFCINNKEGSSGLGENLFLFVQKCPHWILSCMSQTLTRFISSVFEIKAGKYNEASQLIPCGIWLATCELCCLFCIVQTEPKGMSSYEYWSIQLHLLFLAGQTHFVWS